MVYSRALPHSIALSVLPDRSQVFVILLPAPPDVPGGEKVFFDVVFEVLLGIVFGAHAETVSRTSILPVTTSEINDVRSSWRRSTDSCSR